MIKVQPMDENTCTEISREDSSYVQVERNKALKLFLNESVPKWKRVKLNDFKVPSYSRYEYPYFKIGAETEFCLEEISIALNDNSRVKEVVNINKSFGVGKKFTSMVEAFYNAGIMLHVPKNTQVSNVIKIDYRLDRDNPLLLDYNIILAEQSSKVTIVIDYNSENGVDSLFHNGITKIIAKADSEVNIVKLQRMQDTSYHFDSNIAIVEGDARVNWYTIEMGSFLSATDFSTYLDERGSEGTLKSLFLGDGERKLDMSYQMTHLGANSNSDIQSHGALKDKAYSIFRGNLDLKKGAKKSVGAESQTVLLLDKEVRCDALPVLLCEEDDVKANHAASAGQLEKSKLYYLMSRGLSMLEAKKLIIEGSFRPIIDQIPMVDIREIVEEEVTRRIIHG
ncbi:Fe-S cluster assembly protein SufD [Alkaliphilus sp. B6464]|uniref:Fe-S cluster assembly protein SufD n=1 Tax=Alkaliphilus sp. B6464 TaxID=2731219 RepID=UPI001BADFEB5|nr:Fe-S cluster assembly protein SufD [Alkaliphilus sp. B6464]QUH19663.1 Fe-S cluster assembly protein SufD [Alkaliphilus sp. B6464]